MSDSNETPCYGSKDDQLKEHMVKPSQANQFGGEAYVYSEMQARVMVIAALEFASTESRHLREAMQRRGKSRLADTLRDLPAVKKAFDDVERLTAAQTGQSEK